MQRQYLEQRTVVRSAMEAGKFLVKNECKGYYQYPKKILSKTSGMCRYL